MSSHNVTKCSLCDFENAFPQPVIPLIAGDQIKAYRFLHVHPNLQTLAGANVHSTTNEHHYKSQPLHRSNKSILPTSLTYIALISQRLLTSDT